MPNDDKALMRVNFWSGVVVAGAVLSILLNWIAAVVILLLAVTTAYLAVIGIMELAKRNLFFTIVEEGQAKGVTIFGRADRCLLAFTGHRLTGTMSKEKHEEHYHKDSYWDIWKLGQEEKRPEEPKLWYRFVHNIIGIELGGLKWVGLWPFYQIYRYNFRWTSLRGQMPTDEVGDDYKYEETRSREIDYILVRQETYLIDLEGIEDREQLSIDIKLVWTIQVTNPFQALFRVRNWLETSADRLLTYIRREFSETTWMEFQKGSDLQDKLQTILAGINGSYGVKTVGIEIYDLKPPEEFKAAAEKIRMAQAEIDVARHTAEAAVHEAAAITTKAEAEAGRITKVMGAAKNMDDAGVAMKIAEDLAKGGKAVVVMGAARELVKDILGQRREE